MRGPLGSARASTWALRASSASSCAGPRTWVPGGASSTATPSGKPEPLRFATWSAPSKRLFPRRSWPTTWPAGRPTRVAEATFTDPETWYANLPCVVVAAGALITDPAGRVLLVKPNYPELCALPGGIFEHGEPPQASCGREIAHELGLY